MVLNNYYKYLAGIADNGLSNIGTGNKMSPTAIVDTSGTPRNFALNSQYSSVNSDILSNLDIRRNLKLVFGSGSAEEAADDYALASKINTFAAYNTETQASFDSAFKTVFIATVINNSGSNITVSEVGLEKILYTDPGNKDESYSFLMTRIVLTEPVTIPSGSSYTFSFIWSEN